MQADEIVATALSMKCEPPANALRFARMIAEHCAQLVEECPPATSPRDAARHIRTRFVLETSTGT